MIQAVMYMRRWSVSLSNIDLILAAKPGSKTKSLVGSDVIRHIFLWFVMNLVYASPDSMEDQQVKTYLEQWMKNWESSVADSLETKKE